MHVLIGDNFAANEFREAPVPVCVLFHSGFLYARISSSSNSSAHIYLVLIFLPIGIE